MSTGKLFQRSVVVAPGAFIFGFDTLTIPGANLPTTQLWRTPLLLHGFYNISTALWRTLISSIFIGMPTEKYGRKKILCWQGFTFFKAMTAIHYHGYLLKYRGQRECGWKGLKKVIHTENVNYG